MLLTHTESKDSQGKSVKEKKKKKSGGSDEPKVDPKSPQETQRQF